MLIHKFIVLIILLTLNKTFAETKISLVKAENFTATQKNKLDLIVNNLGRVINSPEFKELVINAKVNGVKKFEDNKSQSNETIYENIMKGSEEINLAPDYTWQLSLSLKRILARSTLAYTVSSSPDIFISIKYFDRGREAKIAGTLCHEYMHKLGYDHDKKPTPRRKFSVPYALGDICETIYANKNLQPEKPKVINTCGVWCNLKKAFNVNL